MASSPFAVYDDTARALFGPAPKLELLHENAEYPFAHEAGVYIARDNSLYITSNQFPARPHEQAAAASASGKTVQITKVYLPDDPSSTTVRCEEISPAGIQMANGGVNYPSPSGGDDEAVLFCSQGDHANEGGLVLMETTPPYATRTLVSSFHGRPFNSVNDVVVSPTDGAIWFTDPNYGHEQGIRPRPSLPNQVYRFDPATGHIRAMADGFGRPNGICFSPDARTVYVTDTDWIHGDGTTDLARPSTIYAFDVAVYGGQPFLINRRLFAMADTGIPDGIKCDVHGNVYSGCGDGVNVWSPGGILIGKILVEGGAANFCFGCNGTLYILNEHKLWRATLSDSTKGALLGL